MKYKYVGQTRSREQVEGVLEADDEEEARLKLRTMQVRPISLKAVGIQTGVLDLTLSLGPPVDLKGILVFTRQFGSLIDAGVPVVQCFEILSEQEKRAGFKKVLRQIKSDIEAGSTLADAMRKHPSVFNNLYVSLVEAGEVSGTLEVNLKRIGSQFEKTDRIRAKVKAAMIYPVITLIVSAVVLIFLLVKVIPEVSRLYGENNAKLPELTLMVLGISAWMQEHYAVIVTVLGVAIFGGFFLYRVPAFRMIFDPIVLYVPLFGPLIKKSAVTRLARTMATLVGSGVPLLSAFEICARLMTNLAIKDVVTRAATMVSEGKTIAHGMSQSNIFPPMFVHMVSIGEVSGKLDELLNKVADIYEDEVDDAVGNLTGLIQPVLIVVVGGIIAFLLLAMYLPIFQLAEKVTGA